MNILRGVKYLLTTPTPQGVQLAIDTSSYQAVIKPEEMECVRGYILKGGQGSYSIDFTFAKQYGVLSAAKKKLAMYWWVDPIESVDGHLAKIAQALADKPLIKLIILDIEQYWAVWQEWPSHITNKLSSKTISDSGRRIAQSLTAQGYTVLIYTRMSFVNEFSPDMKTWITGYDLILASYPYEPMVTTWADFIALILPRLLPYWPKDHTGRVSKGWQCSGDQYKLPGTYGSTGGLSALDIDLIKASPEEFDIWWQTGTDPGDVPPPAPVPVCYILTYSPYRNLRAGPGTAYNVIGRVYFGDKVQVVKLDNGWGQLISGEWMLISTGGVLNGVKLC